MKFEEFSEKTNEYNNILEENVNQEVSTWLESFIEQLPKKYTQALILTEYKNLTQKQLAEQLGLSFSGAKSRVQRARKKLKHILLECCQLEFDYCGNVLDYTVNNEDCACLETINKK